MKVCLVLCALPAAFLDNGWADQADTCSLAIKALTAHLPELTSSASAYSWRGLTTTFTCDSEGDVASATVKWQEGRGLLSDARSAGAALGARIANDTGTALRGAIDRCLASGARAPGDRVTVTTSRAEISCVTTPASAEIRVRRRSGN